MLILTLQCRNYWCLRLDRISLRASEKSLEAWSSQEPAGKWMMTLIASLKRARRNSIRISWIRLLIFWVSMSTLPSMLRKEAARVGRATLLSRSQIKRAKTLWLKNWVLSPKRVARVRIQEAETPWRLNQTLVWWAISSTRRWRTRISSKSMAYI